MAKLAELQYRFAGHIRDPQACSAPEGIEDRRLGVYRSLFFNNIKSLLASHFPVLKKIVGDAAWAALIREFMRQHRAHTPLFPELGREFLQFLQEQGRPAAGDPPFMLELAHYEWAELSVGMDPAESDEVPCDPDGDLLSGRPLVSPLARHYGYRFPVHRLRPEYQPAEPPAQATRLLIYRRRDDRVRFMQLKPLSAVLFDRLQANHVISGRQVLLALAAELGMTLDERDWLDRGLAQMTVWRQREIILGTAP